MAHSEEQSWQDHGTVLVVDDDVDTVEVTKKALKTFTKFEVLTATSGEAALSIIQRQNIDVIVLDYVMPGMDGAACFRSIKEKSKLIPVIFLTGFPEAGRERAQLEQGAFDFIAKPVSPRDLVILVRDAFRTACLMRRLQQKRA